MFRNIIKNLKEEFIKKTESNNKKNIENLIFFLVLLIITIIAINTIWGGKKDDIQQEENKTTYKKLAQDINNELNGNNLEKSEYNLEKDLENILAKISGVGKVQVLITYSETEEIVAMYNEKSTSNNTEENDANGGTRKIEQVDNDKEIIYEEINGTKVPITKKVLMPKIEGAIVTAEGAKNANVKTNIIQAVSAVTGVPTYRIQVFEMST